jgi:rhamnosyltransferase
VTATAGSNDRVVLAISAFRSDDSVRALLRTLPRAEASPFVATLVVDSLGSGALVRPDEADGLPDYRYENHPTNLGSSGNFARRVEWAATFDADWVYTVNHDGHVELDTVASLVRTGQRIDRCGAVYPLRYYEQRGTWNLTGTSRRARPSKGTTTRPTGDPIPVTWASSNGALLSLAPVRDGLLPWADLWMGWEDLGYGWLLDAHGWKQVVDPNAVFVDGYECRTVRVAGRDVTITDKPSWYTYYQIRNLLLCTRRAAHTPTDWAIAAGRIGLELGLSGLVRNDRSRRLRHLAAGVRDGLLGRTGKWRLP